MSRLALVLAVFLAPALALAIARASPPAFAPPEPGIMDIARPAEETCGRCHADVLAEWRPGLHHRAWTNTNIQKETDGFARLDCRPCHSPAPVLPQGLELAPRTYRPPTFRPENLEAGVHCLSCHALAGARGVAALRDVPDAPCRPHRDERIASVALCASCHDPTHQAAQEYFTSEACKDGLRCQDCHMPEVTRASGAAGRSHVFPGGFDGAKVRKGCVARAWLEGRAVVVSLENRTGHKLPGEVPSRSLAVDIEARDASGAVVFEKHELFRRSFKNAAEHDRPDNRLRPDEKRLVREPLPASAASVTARVIFRSLPLQPERHAFVLLDEKLELK